METKDYENLCEDCVHKTLCKYCCENFKEFHAPMLNDECTMRKVLAKTQGELAQDTEHRSPYQTTVSGMLSPDYKERFKAEYQQTKIRHEKLKAFCNRVEAALRTECSDCKHIEMPKHDCPLDLLRDQQRAMGEYLHCLEIRAVIEGIKL